MNDLDKIIARQKAEAQKQLDENLILLRKARNYEIFKSLLASAAAVLVNVTIVLVVNEVERRSA